VEAAEWQALVAVEGAVIAETVGDDFRRTFLHRHHGRSDVCHMRPDQAAHDALI
jgi:hypothetical protein